MAKTSIALFWFSILLLVLAISEIKIINGNLCDKDATYYRGKCVDEKCSKNCKTFENAESGYCRPGEVKLICVCTYDCAKLKPRPPPTPRNGKPAPPPENEKPAPPPENKKPAPPPKNEKPTQHDE